MPEEGLHCPCEFFVRGVTNHVASCFRVLNDCLAGAILLVVNDGWQFLGWSVGLVLVDPVAAANHEVIRLVRLSEVLEFLFDASVLLRLWVVD